MTKVQRSKKDENRLENNLFQISETTSFILEYYIEKSPLRDPPPPVFLAVIRNQVKAGGSLAVGGIFCFLLMRFASWGEGDGWAIRVGSFLAL